MGRLQPLGSVTMGEPAGLVVVAAAAAVALVMAVAYAARR